MSYIKFYSKKNKNQCYTHLFQKKEKNIQVSTRVDGLLRTVSMKATHTEDKF